MRQGAAVGEVFNEPLRYALRKCLTRITKGEFESQRDKFEPRVPLKLIPLLINNFHPRFLPCMNVCCFSSFMGYKWPVRVEYCYITVH